MDEGNGNTIIVRKDLCGWRNYDTSKLLNESEIMVHDKYRNEDWVSLKDFKDYEREEVYFMGLEVTGRFIKEIQGFLKQ